MVIIPPSSVGGTDSVVTVAVKEGGGVKNAVSKRASYMFGLLNEIVACLLA